MPSKKAMTHGEVYVARKTNINFKQNLGSITRSLEKLPKKMSKEEASRYYSIKFTTYWLKQYRLKEKTS